MPSETTDNISTKPNPSLDDGSDDKIQKHIDLEIRQMISALMNHLASLQHVHKVAGGSSTSGHHDHQQEEDHDHQERGARIITLAGNNVGATMRGEMDEKATGLPPPAGLPMGEDEPFMSTYVNSNFQAVNNSIMMGGSYSTQDPGVHMDISDYMEHQTPPQPNPTADSKHGGKKGKKKYKGSSSSESDQQTEHSE